MKLSNFDWTDKDSVKWFIMLPTGHEGPYSLNTIFERHQKKNLSSFTKVWAEGLPQPVALKDLLENKLDDGVESDLPPLPLPDEEFPLPPLPIDAETEILSNYQDIDSFSPPKSTLNRKFIFSALAIICGFGIFAVWVSGKQEFSIRRFPKMNLELHQRIERELSFDGWGKKIFFKEFVASDFSHIWLITSSYQTCDVETQFQSVDGKLLSFKDEKVAFKSKGKLDDHVTELNAFDFSAGNKIIPGLYDMKVVGKNCSWDGFLPSIMNVFTPADETYTAKTKVILFPKGAVEFNAVLERLLAKKNEIEVKNKNQEDLFWQGLQEKFQTMLAISLQIEEHLLNFVSRGPVGFDNNLKPSVNVYANKFGRFLTNFVISNEAYFKEISNSDLKGISQKRNYEMLVRITAKNIGFESMKIIEDLQKLKKPTAAQLKPFEARIKKTYSAIKEKINLMIIQVTEDRSQP